MKTIRTLALCAGLAPWASLAWAPAAQAASISLEASDNATVQVAGPRTGSSGKAFFNMEGSNNGNFASFGVADFTFPGGAGAVGVTSATLQLTQSNAGFSMPGPLSIYYTPVTTSSIIQPGDPSQVKYQGANNGLAGVDPALAPWTLWGTGNYAVVSTGTVDNFTLTFTPPTLASLLGALNGGGVIRLVITPDTASTAATYAGYTNNTLAGPTLVLDVVVPEPASVGLASLASAGACLASRPRKPRRASCLC